MAGYQVKLGLVSPDGEEPRFVALEAVIHNGTDGPLALRASEARAPSIALEIQTPEGAPVRLGPPPLPVVEEPTHIPPDERLTLHYEGFLDRSLPPGEYRVRFRGRPHFFERTEEELPDSNWVTFHIGASAMPPPPRSLGFVR